MALATAPGYPQYSGTPLNYIPKLYSKKVLVKYYATGVLPAIANTTYAGEVKNQGDEVIIRTRPTVSTFDYQKGQTLQRESLGTASISLLVDKAKGYCFLIGEIDEKQADIVLNKEFIEDSAHQMEIAIETSVFAAIYANAHADNQGSTAGAKSANINLGISGTPLQLTKSNILDSLVDLQTVLDEQNVPDDGNRWVVLPPRIIGLINKSDLKNAAFAGSGESILMKNRFVGQLSGFNIHMSNLLATTVDGATTVTNIPFGHKDALCYVTSFVKDRVMEVPDTFGKQYDGLRVYGYKIIKTEAMGWMYAYAG